MNKDSRNLFLKLSVFPAVAVLYYCSLLFVPLLFPSPIGTWHIDIDKTLKDINHIPEWEARKFKSIEEFKIHLENKLKGMKFKFIDREQYYYKQFNIAEFTHEGLVETHHMWKWHETEPNKIKTAVLGSGGEYTGTFTFDRSKGIWESNGMATVRRKYYFNR